MGSSSVLYHGIVIILLLSLSNVFIQIGPVPGLSANFTIIPSSKVVAEEELAIFRCQHPHAFDVLWLINGSLIRLFPGDVTAEIRTISGRPSLYILYINAHSGFNKSLVQCRAVFNDGSPSQLSPSVELLVQGSLGAVRNPFASVWKGVIYITWEAPFTLNITNTEPDITYCVEIFNNSNDYQIVHTCNLTDTEFLYPLEQNISSSCNLDECCNITVIIVPINEVGNGLSAQAHISSASNVTITHTDVHVIHSGRMKAILFIQPAGSACNCSLLLWKINIVNATYAFNESNGLRCEYSIISLEFSTDMLPFNSRYEGNISVFSNIFSINISTNDVQNVLLSEIEPNTIRLTATFINNSRAKGALVILIPDSPSGTTNSLVVDEPQLTFPFIVPKPFETTTFTSETVQYGVPFGTYKVLTYDIEENGLLNVPIAVPAIISTTVLHGHATLSADRKLVEPQEVNITTNIFERFLIINCMYVDGINDIQGCLVILSSRLSLEPQLHVQIQSRDSPLPLVYSVKPETRYTITTLAVKRDSGIINSTIYSMEVYVDLKFNGEVGTIQCQGTYKIALGVSTSISIITILVLLTILIVKFCATNGRLRKPADQNKPATIEMQKCEAYEVLPIRRR